MFRPLIIAVLLSVAATLQAAERNPKWAVKIEQPGLPNLHRVTPNLYRSAQPTAEGLGAAERLGIKTVVSLRAFHSDKKVVESTKLKIEGINFKTWHPEDEDVVRFLKLVTDTSNGPFLVHCQHGADRTGTMIAVYRIAVQGWEKDDAIKEMTEGGFGYHEMWSNLIRYLKDLEIESLKRKAGLRSQ